MHIPLKDICAVQVSHNPKIDAWSDRMMIAAGSTIISQLEKSVINIGNTVSPAPRRADE